MLAVAEAGALKPELEPELEMRMKVGRVGAEEPGSPGTRRTAGWRSRQRWAAVQQMTADTAPARRTFAAACDRIPLATQRQRERGVAAGAAAGRATGLVPDMDMKRAVAIEAGMQDSDSMLGRAPAMAAAGGWQQAGQQKRGRATHSLGARGPANCASAQGRLRLRRIPAGAAVAVAASRERAVASAISGQMISFRWPWMLVLVGRTRHAPSSNWRVIGF